MYRKIIVPVALDHGIGPPAPAVARRMLAVKVGANNR